ncbi:hypothetical protein CDL15_Pgr014969 [Punica granatum]|uniref:Uncharacterized protein n=1 Tax=Punica granatum TaxID=22663 RepID=A0A218X0I2_PUNGR|nr:hypothetical protein CDL15_Pgr014969 [Punica granatum]PKI67868.1 hypothetical protein CRG98_011767 [Punica granatum]
MIIDRIGCEGDSLAFTVAIQRHERRGEARSLMAKRGYANIPRRLLPSREWLRGAPGNQHGMVGSSSVVDVLRWVAAARGGCQLTGIACGSKLLPCTAVVQLYLWLLPRLRLPRAVAAG